jgi:hypothetical protein
MENLATKDHVVHPAHQDPLVPLARRDQLVIPAELLAVVQAQLDPQVPQENQARLAHLAAQAKQARMVALALQALPETLALQVAQEKLAALAQLAIQVALVHQAAAITAHQLVWPQDTKRHWILQSAFYIPPLPFWSFLHFTTSVDNNSQCTHFLKRSMQLFSLLCLL